jgi:hypothetical protein
MHDAPHDRHIRLATDGALFAEAVRPLTGLRRDPGPPSAMPRPMANPSRRSPR